MVNSGEKWPILVKVRKSEGKWEKWEKVVKSGERWGKVEKSGERWGKMG